jgi:hypothetical protein
MALTFGEVAFRPLKRITKRTFAYAGMTKPPCLVASATALVWADATAAYSLLC